MGFVDRVNALNDGVGIVDHVVWFAIIAVALVIYVTAVGLWEVWRSRRG